MTRVVVLCHGRHLATKGWEKLVMGDGDRIGTAPLALFLAIEHSAELIFGTGAPEKDGLKECAYTQKYLLENLARVVAFPEFHKYRAYATHECEEMFCCVISGAHLDTESQNTKSEIENAVRYAKSVGAIQLIQVTSPFHAPRCARDVAELRESGFDFGDVLPMVVSAKSSTEECSAKTTVIMEHPHRGDDPMIHASLAPHHVYSRMFRLPAVSRMLMLENDDRILREFGV